MAEQNVFNLMQNDEIGLLWKKIYQLHQKTKIYLLTAEEISENGDALIQPLKEHRDAYDHIVRIFASGVFSSWDAAEKKSTRCLSNSCSFSISVLSCWLAV